VSDVGRMTGIWWRARYSPAERASLTDGLHPGDLGRSISDPTVHVVKKSKPCFWEDDGMFDKVEVTWLCNTPVDFAEPASAPEDASRRCPVCFAAKSCE
jgi:hypothetical protein